MTTRRATRATQTMCAALLAMTSLTLAHDVRDAHAQARPKPVRPPITPDAAATPQPQLGGAREQVRRLVRASPGVFFISATRQGRLERLVGSSWNMNATLTDPAFKEAADLLRLPDAKVIVWGYDLKPGRVDAPSVPMDCQCLRFWEQKIMVHVLASPPNPLRRFDALDLDEERYLSKPCSAKPPQPPQLITGAPMSPREAELPRSSPVPDHEPHKVSKLLARFVQEVRASTGMRPVAYVILGPHKYVDVTLHGELRLLDRSHEKLWTPLAFKGEQTSLELWPLNVQSVLSDPAKLCGCLAWAKQRLMTRHGVTPVHRPRHSTSWLRTQAIYNETPGLDPASVSAQAATCQAVLPASPKVLKYKDFMTSSTPPSSQPQSTPSGPVAQGPSDTTYGKPRSDAAPRPSSPPSCRVEGATCDYDSSCCQDGYSDFNYTANNKPYTWVAKCIQGRCVKPKCVTEGKMCVHTDTLAQRYHLNTSCCLDGKSEDHTPNGTRAFTCAYFSSQDPLKRGTCKRP